MASVSLRKCPYRNETLAILRNGLVAPMSLSQRDTCDFMQWSRCAIVATAEGFFFSEPSLCFPSPSIFIFESSRPSFRCFSRRWKKNWAEVTWFRWWLKSSRRAITLFWAGNNSHGICDLFIKQAYRATNENETSATDCAAAAHTFILFCVLEIIVVVFLKNTFSEFFHFFRFYHRFSRSTVS